MRKTPLTENWRLRVQEILSPEERSAEWRPGIARKTSST